MAKSAPARHLRTKCRVSDSMLGDGDGVVPGGAARPVRDRDERGPERLQLPDRLPQLPFAIRVPGWEELEGERGRSGADEVADGRMSTGHHGRKTKRHTPTLAGRPPRPG